MKPWYLGYLSNVCIDPSFWYMCQNLARIDIVGELKLVRLLPLLFYLWHYQTPTGVNWCLMMCVACFLFPGSSAPDLWPFHNYALLLRDQGWEEGAGQKYRGRRIVRNHLTESSKWLAFLSFFLWRCAVVVLQEAMAHHFINTWCLHSHSSDTNYDLNIGPYSLASIWFLRCFRRV